MTNKCKRVRTGCLTCRERHLKCDEAMPDCVNCRRSSRRCKRGLRLNFQDTTIYIPVSMPLSRDWAVHFLDESRHIASAYRGGLKRYVGIGQNDCRGRSPLRKEQQNDGADGAAPLAAISFLGNNTKRGPTTRNADTEKTRQTPADPLAWHENHHKAMAPSRTYGRMHIEVAYKSRDIEPCGQDLSWRRNAHQHEANTSAASDAMQHSPIPTDNGSVSNQTLPGTACRIERPSIHPGDSDVCAWKDLSSETRREFIGTQEELEYMQAFVDGVGVWMDFLDHQNHFSQVVPGYALECPLLWNALLACGAKHLSFTDSNLSKKAECYFNTATLLLLRTLQNGDRDGQECALTSVILHVYEVIAEKPARQMSHYGGARALIRERGWDARNSGIGSACFWLSMGMEVLCCLAMNWLITWDPDEWGLATDWVKGDAEDTETGRERWVHRAFYIVAKVANFRASTPLFLDSDPHDQQARLAARLAEWQELKKLCDLWNNMCPRSMHPVGYLNLGGTQGESSFPRLWLTRNSAILGRLFYHTAQCILTQTNPMERAQLSEEMKTLQLHHARQILGIVASSRYCRSLSIAMHAASVASAALVDARERREALSILDSIQSHPGGSIRHFDRKRLARWAHEELEGGKASVNERGAAALSQGHAAVFSAAPFLPAEPSWQVPDASKVSTVNPLNSACFNHPNHPYKPWYRPVDK